MNWHQKKNMFKKHIMFKCKINIGNMFPNEIMLKIFSNLDLKDLGRCTMVSKRFSELSRHSMLILLKNVTGLKDISRAMKVLHAHSILMECVWKFYEIDKVWQKEKHFVGLRMYVEPIHSQLASLQNSGHIKKFTRIIDSQFKKVSCFLKKKNIFTAILNRDIITSLFQVALKLDLFSMQTSKPKLVKLMDCLSTLPGSLKISLFENLSGK